MWLGLTGLYRAKWTAEIHDEWKRNLLLNRPELSASQLDRTSSLMDEAIPDALVTGYECLCDGLELPDEDDRHVLAAAIRCQADVIVTFNLKDFPTDALNQFDIEPQHPDEFVLDLWDLDQAAVLLAIQKHRQSLKNPPVSAEPYLDMLMKLGMTQTVSAIKPYALLI